MGQVIGELSDEWDYEADGRAGACLELVADLLHWQEHTEKLTDLIPLLAGDALALQLLSLGQAQTIDRSA